MYIYTHLTEFIVKLCIYISTNGINMQEKKCFFCEFIVLYIIMLKSIADLCNNAKNEMYDVYERENDHMQLTFAL